MSPALYGLISAAGLGTADFMARFSARAVGAPLAYTIVLLVGAATTTVVMLVSQTPLVWSAAGMTLAVAHGISVSIMCVLLYAGLARGPVSIVAPIVAAHPALVLAVNVVMGTRPNGLQWAAMAAIIAGGLLIARSAEEHEPPTTQDDGGMRTTLLLAIGACLAYALLVLTGQAAAPMIGELQTVLVGRWAGLAFMLTVLAAQKIRPAVPPRWMAFLLAQGVLDTLGYMAFMQGSVSHAPHVTMVIASTFSVFTVIFARVFLKEAISTLQWTAIAMISLGTAVLAGGG